MRSTISYTKMHEKYKDWHKHRKMDKAELIEVEFCADTNPQFLSDVHFTGESHPLLREEQHERGVRKGPLKVTLLDLSCSVGQCGSQKNSTGVSVWSMVVADGTFGLFKVVLNSGLSQDFPQDQLHPGSTIIVHEWSVIWNKDMENGIKRGVAFVSEFDFAPAPHSSEGETDGDSAVTPDYSRSWIDSKAIARVKTESVMMFLDSHQHEEGFFHWIEMTASRVRKGDFVATSAPFRL